MIMDLVLIVIIKIIFVSVDRKIVLVLLLEKALDGGWPQAGINIILPQQAQNQDP